MSYKVEITGFRAENYDVSSQNNEVLGLTSYHADITSY